MWAEDGAHWGGGGGGECARGCTGEGAREPPQRSFVEGSRRPRSQQGASPPPVPRGHLALRTARISLSPTSPSPAAALLPSEPVRPAPGQPPGAGAACWAAAPRPPGPRAGGGARGGEGTAAWAGEGGGGRGRGEEEKGGEGAEQEGACWPRGGRAPGAAWAAALLPAAAAAEAAPRPASSCLPLAARGCRAHWPEERRRRQELEGEPAAGECEPSGRGPGGPCFGGHRDRRRLPARKGRGARSARTPGWGAGSWLP